MRIYKDKALLHQRFLIIQSHSVQINERFWINKDADIPKLKNAVALARLRIEANVIAQARAAATLHAQTQSALLGRNTLLGHSRTNLRDRLFCDRDSSCRGLRGGLFSCGGHLAITALIGQNRIRSGAAWPARMELVPFPFARFAILNYFAWATTGFSALCFFFQSPMAARIASSARTEQ